MMVRLSSLFLTFLCSLVLLSVGAQAQWTHIHRVSQDETLAGIAQHYYGDPTKESLIVQENGLSAEGGSAIVVGMRLIIPYTRYHRVAEGETWAVLAERYYGDRTRASAIEDANRRVYTDQPATGAEVIIPYPLRHTAIVDEELDDVANRYYGNDEGGLTRLRRFNRLSSRQLTRGQLVLIPVSNLLLSERGRTTVAAATGQRPSGGEARDIQRRAEDSLNQLQDDVQQGNYVRVIAEGHRLLGSGALTAPQQGRAQLFVGMAYVALNQEEAAYNAFRSALTQDSSLRLDARRASPRIRAVFDRALQDLGN